MTDNKVVSKPMEIPFDDGTGEIIADAEKQKEEIAKDAEKKLKDAAEIVDDINDAEEELLPKAKRVFEKFTLDESDDNILNEGIDHDSDRYDTLVHNLFDAIHKVLRRTWLNEFDKEDIFSAIEEASYHIEDILDYDDGILRLDESDELDEAIPKDLSKAYKNRPFRIGAGNMGGGYGDIDRSFGARGADRDVSRTGFDGVQYDFQNSSYEQITPEEALKIKKSGNASKLRIIYDGQLVAFNDAGKPLYKASRNWNSPGNLYVKGNKHVEHTTLLPFKDILAGASKIYVADEVAPNADLIKSRSENPESPRYRFNNVAGDQANALFNIKGYKHRGVDYDTYAVSRADRYKGDIEEYKKRIDTYNKHIADLQNEIERTGDPNGEIAKNIKNYETEISYFKDRINNLKGYIASAKNTVKDRKAYVRNLSSLKSLNGTVKDFLDLRNKRDRVKNELNSAANTLDDIKTNGSPQVKKYRSELEYAKSRLRDINKDIARLELYLDSADEDDAAEIEKASGLVDKYTNELNGILASIDEIKNRKHEELEVSEGEEQLDEAKIISAFSSYKPWSGAVKTFDRIEEAGKLDQLEALIDDLYPEGIDETQLNDILWFEDDSIYKMLGMGIEGEGNE